MSDDKVLFQITEGHLDTGLRGFPVGWCRTSKVDPVAGVSYVGHPIADLAYLEPEAVVFLLLERRLPTDEELSAFQADLVGRRGLDTRVIDVLRSLPREGHPMEWLIAGMSAMGMVSKTGDWAEDAKNAIARTPELIAAIFRIRSGWGDPIPASDQPGLVEDFVRMLGVPDADPVRLTRLLRTFYVLHMDHGGGNLSTFTGKAVASGHADLFASLGAAMAGLSGPLHGRANQDCLAFVREVGTDDPKPSRRSCASGWLAAGRSSASATRCFAPRTRGQRSSTRWVSRSPPTTRTSARPRCCAKWRSACSQRFPRSATRTRTSTP